MIDVDPTDERVPRNARKLAELAVEHGYAVRLTWAEWAPDNGGVEALSLAVRMRLKRRGKFDLAGVWRNGRYWFGGGEFQPMNLTQLKVAIGS